MYGPIFVLILVVVSFFSTVFTYEYADVDISLYHKAESLCHTADSTAKSFDRNTVKCENGAMFDLKEDK